MTAPRVVLRPDAYHVPVDGGAFLLGNRGEVSITGESISQWIDRLAPYLDGRYTLDELTAGLAPERREMVEKVVEALRSRDLVRLRSGPRLRAASVDGGRYRHELTFVDYFRDYAATAFARYRSLTALVIGSGPLVPAIARAALRSGVQGVCVALTGGPTHLDQFVQARDEAAARDPDQWLVYQRLPERGESVLASLIGGADLALHVVAEPHRRTLRRVERWAARHGVPLAQVALGAGEAWLVPAAEPGAVGWSAMRPRVRPTAPDPGDAGPEAATVVACQVVQATFRTFTGVAPVPDGPRPIRRVDLRSLSARQHHVLPHPFRLPATAADRAGFRARLAELTSGEPLTGADFSRHAARCVDDRCGIVSLHEHDWTQSPLHLTEARARDPVGLLAGASHISVTGAGLTFSAARTDATLRAMARYGALLVDPRRLVDSAGAPLVDPRADPHRLLARRRADARRGAVWGVDLADPDRVRAVPAPVAFPYLGTPTPPPAHTAGLAGALEWDGAVLAGLLAHCRRLSLAAIPDAGTPYPAVDLASAVLDPDGARCRDILAQLGELPATYDLSRTLGIPTYAFCAGAGTIAYATGPTAGAAVSAGLLQVTRAVQARIHDQPGAGVEPVPDLPGPLRGRPEDAVAVESREWNTEAVAERLRERGYRAAAVPLDHDPELARILPYLVHVVVGRNGASR